MRVQSCVRRSRCSLRCGLVPGVARAGCPGKATTPRLPSRMSVFFQMSGIFAAIFCVRRVEEVDHLAAGLERHSRSAAGSADRERLLAVWDYVPGTLLPGCSEVYAPARGKMTRRSRPTRQTSPGCEGRDRTGDDHAAADRVDLLFVVPTYTRPLARIGDDGSRDGNSRRHRLVPSGEARSGLSSASSRCARPRPPPAGCSGTVAAEVAALPEHCRSVSSAYSVLAGPCETPTITRPCVRSRAPAPRDAGARRVSRKRVTVGLPPTASSADPPPTGPRAVRDVDASGNWMDDRCEVGCHRCASDEDPRHSTAPSAAGTRQAACRRRSSCRARRRPG